MLLQEFRNQAFHKGALRCALVAAVLVDGDGHWSGLTYCAGCARHRQRDLRSDRWGCLGI
jgi:hypothetical protein